MPDAGNTTQAFPEWARPFSRLQPVTPKRHGALMAPAVLQVLSSLYSPPLPAVGQALRTIYLSLVPVALRVSDSLYPSPLPAVMWVSNSLPWVYHTRSIPSTQ